MLSEMRKGGREGYVDIYIYIYRHWSALVCIDFGISPLTTSLHQH